MSQTPQNVPVPVILRCRELQKEGYFKRRIVKRTPRDVEMDIAEFKCGHSRAMFAWTDSEVMECTQCLDEWLKSNVVGEEEKLSRKD